MSQLYCTVALQVELLDELEECFYLSKMPLFQEFSEKFIKLNNELYNISVKTEEDDISRQEWEKMMKNIICKIPELNIKQLPPRTKVCVFFMFFLKKSQWKIWIKVYIYISL